MGFRGTGAAAAVLLAGSMVWLAAPAPVRPAVSPSEPPRLYAQPPIALCDVRVRVASACPLPMGESATSHAGRGASEGGPNALVPIPR